MPTTLAEWEPDGRVAVAMSGGVDSSAAAVKLRARGCDVMGLTALLTAGDASLVNAQRAEAMCEALGIAHHTVDLRGEFHRLVVEPFVAEYARGRTPNPCVRCNEHIKFGLLLKAARELGADRIATGHYARLMDCDGAPCLYRAVDLKKDQSYALHHLAAEQLAAAVLPNGASTRAENEALVAEAGLPVSPAPESQDICFLPEQSYQEWLREAAPGAFRPGEIVDESGEAVGAHSGLAAYTVGQRKGLGLGGPGGRKFVLHVDTQRNRVVVGSDERLWVNWCEVEDVKLHGGDEQLACEVMTRYNGPLTPATVTVGGGMGLPGGARHTPHDTRQPDSVVVRVEFDRPSRAPTPGQSAVFYVGDRCIGGGVICRTELTERFEGSGD